MKRILVLTTILTCILTQYAYSQLEPVDVADLTIKVGGMQTEELYYGFAEGDQLVFNFEDVKGKPMKEIEIIELPSNSKFMDYKSSSITDKKIKVNQNSVYKFSFKNTAIGGRICKVKIQRIPQSEDLISFNTDWKWETLYDTTYVPYTEDSLVGYDTLHYKEKVKELVKTEQVEEMLFDKNQRVHSYYNENPSRTYLKVTLPTNKKEPYKEEKVIAWAYWIGVGEESQEAYSKNVKSLGGAASTLASTFGTPLAGLAIGTITELMVPTKGDDVAYWFIADFANVQAFLNKQEFYQFDKGKGIAAYGRNTNKLQGTFYIGLWNDNNTRGIDVDVKIVAVKEVKIYEDKEYDRQKVTPRYVKLNKKRMVVNTTKIRVNAD
ncbi:MAG: hypothetical protein U9Q83_08435 [Bacteroidota bacterium]|nr:hypothetical protein [Bacteroidota bacterium]